jgi:glycosyltransferase involved in cell wall biosynthesis
MEMHPNQEAMDRFLKRIWPRLVAQVPDIEFCIVGRNPPSWLEEAGKKDPRVHVTGYVDDVRPFFTRSAVCVCPIVSGGGTRLKILDSLAMGVPVVSTPFAASGLSLEHERHLLLAETDKQFTDETLRLLRNPSLRAELASAGAECVDRRYSWTVVGRTLLDAYEAALDRRGSFS